MPATRIAKNPSKLRPERFISHEAYSNYLPLNLVAKRAELLSDSKHRRLLYFLQNQSIQTGGLSTLSAELAEALNMDATQLQCELERLCLDPEFGFEDITTNRDPVVIIENYRQKLNKQVSHDLAETSIKKQAFDCLDYAISENTFVIIEGDSRMGKTVSAQNWCQQHQGEAIYIKLEPCADEKSFFRTIARAIGTSYSAGRKSADIRHRIEDALHLTKQLLVIDEAHYIHNLARRPSSEPRKLEWLRSSLIDKGVPIALISTPQWDQRIASAESIGWNSRQIKGRIGLKKMLPAKLNEKDIKAIVKHLYKGDDERIIKLLTGTGFYYDEHVAVIERLVTRATFFAKEKKLVEPQLEYFQKALKETK